MALTRDFRQTVQARAERDQAFRLGLYEEAMQVMLNGDFATARILLRDFINATIGFSGLSHRVGISDKSLMRMFGPAGNPTATNLMAVLKTLRVESGLAIQVRASSIAASRATRSRAA